MEIDEAGEENRYLHGRNGDNLITPFQCDLCHFRNLKDRDPDELIPADQWTLKCIRRANLDALWATEPPTVARNASELRRGANIALSLGIKSHKLFKPMGPFPLEDSFGMAAAIVMLELSRNKGKNAEKVQFNTIRKFRAAFSNAYQASASAGTEGMVMAKEQRKMEVTKCPSHGNWFERFNKGCHKRMGDVVIPDRALAVEIIVEMLRILEAEWVRGDCLNYNIAMEAVMYIVGYCCALRGEEIPKCDLGGTMKHFEESGAHKPSFVIVALIGRVKGETGLRYHILPLVTVTRSGLKPRVWIGRLLDCYRSRNVEHGALFRGRDGLRIRQSEMNQFLHARLNQVQRSRPDLIGRDVEVEEVYSISRSPRRGSTSRASDRGIDEDVVNTNNRWRKVENAKGKAPSFSMQERYTYVKLTVNQGLRYSAEM